MEPAFQLALSMGVPTLAVLFGILINNSRLSDLRTDMNARFADVLRIIDARFAAVDARFAAVDARFGEMNEKLLRVEQVMDARLTRIEQDLEGMRNR